MITSRSLVASSGIAATAARRFFDAVATGDPQKVALALHPSKRASASGWASYGASLKAAGQNQDLRVVYHLGNVTGRSMEQIWGVVQVEVGMSTYLVVTRAITDDEDRVSDVLPLI